LAERLVVVRGGGDLGSGVALRLWRAGFDVVIAECAKPVAVRRTVSFSESVYEGSSRVEEAVGHLTGAGSAEEILRAGHIAVIIDPTLAALPVLQSCVIVDAILAKRNVGTSVDMASLVVGLGPGFFAGRDVHAVVETNRGPHLGRVIWDGGAEPNTGEPGLVGGKSSTRVLRAPRDGKLTVARQIGDMVEEEAVVAAVAGTEVLAPFRGMVRGLMREGSEVTRGMKIGDIDPRRDRELCCLVSDKALAVAGGVLEAVLMQSSGRKP
jgi:xanthine dehydrogenase accessory factor